MSRWTCPREGRDDAPKPRMGRGTTAAGLFLGDTEEYLAFLEFLEAPPPPPQPRRLSPAPRKKYKITWSKRTQKTIDAAEAKITRSENRTQPKSKPRPFAVDQSDRRLHPRVPMPKEKRAIDYQQSWLTFERSFQDQRNEAAHRHTLQLIDQLFPYTPPEEIIWSTTT